MKNVQNLIISANTQLIKKKIKGKELSSKSDQ